jgi:hypothetical protein
VVLQQARAPLEALGLGQLLDRSKRALGRQYGVVRSIVDGRAAFDRRIQYVVMVVKRGTVDCWLTRPPYVLTLGPVAAPVWCTAFGNVASRYSETPRTNCSAGYISSYYN